MLSLKWLLIAFCIYIFYKLVTGPKKGKERKNPYIRIHYGRQSSGSDRSKTRRRTNNRKQSLDNMEEAEYEDITDVKKGVEK